MEERTLEGIKYKVEDALTELAQKKDLNNSDLEAITRLLCVLEQIGRVGGNSYGNAYDNSYNSFGRAYDGGSYRSRGSYRSHNSNGNGAGYSGHDIRGKMLSQLEQMLDSAHNEQEKNMVESWMRYVEKQQN
ncbi:MAG: hypothetical protein IKN12_04955 [Selenomonadaceae bacterium]|nr:hypothetical protein [Selenomonadaceae bacterium]